MTVAGDEVAHGKSAPDMFLAAAERIAGAPEHCPVIEDSAPGVAAGLAAGMRTIGVVRDGAGLTHAHLVLDRLTAHGVLAAST